MLSALSSKISLPILRCAAVLAQLVSMGALSSACSAGDPAAPAKPRENAVERVSKTQAAVSGVDGTTTINGVGTIVNRYTALAANAAANSSTIQVASVATLASSDGALAPGDLVLVVQMQGATLSTGSNDSTWGTVTALNSAGLYEMVEVLSVDAGTNTITLACGLRNAYTTAGRTQVVRVPQYDSLTLAAGASIVAPPWDGTTGGIVAIDVRNTFTLTGDVDVSARGFRGGITDDVSADSATSVTIYASPESADGARKGEGIGGQRTEFGRAPAANGGGGGNSHNGGGGGGANAKALGGWTGQGVFDLTSKGGATAWLLDPNYSATASEGGGRGGYTYSSNDADALTTSPGKAAWGGNNRRERGGLGGRPVPSDAASRIFLGGGGGAGDGNNGHAGRGGNGGGIVIVRAGTVSGAGRILANGEAGVNSNSTGGGSTSGDAPGGGGGGGAVVVRATTVSGFAVQATGGAGGNQVVNNANEAEGPGGGGGGGFVSISGTVTMSVLGGPGGSTTSPAVAEFPANGATRGGVGFGELGAAASGSIPYCADTTAPDTTIATGPTGTVSDNTGNFTFTSNDATATFECSVDGGAFVACTTPLTTSVLTDGPHTFQVRARDTLGNVDATPASRSWTVDTTAPTTTLNSGPSGIVSDNTADFTFTGSEPGVTFQCRVDNGAFAACTSPHTTVPLSEGAHTFEVRATDGAGNVGPAVSRAWTVDTVAPNTILNTGPMGTVSDVTGDFTFSSPDGTATFECSVDDAAFTACTSPHVTAALSDGPHTFAVRARDAAGNVDASPATRAWTIDAAAPETVIDTGPNGTVADTTGDFTFSSPDGTATFECRVDTAAFAPCTSPHVTAALSDGPHTFQVRARDALGNVDASPATRAWTIDATAPETVIISAPPALTSDNTGDFTFSSPDGTATFECRVDTAAFAACTSPHATGTLTDGLHTFQVRARDTLGNVDTSPAVSTWTIDTTAPTVTILTQPPATTSDTTGDFTFSSPDATATFECNVDGGTFATCSSPFATNPLSPGAHTFSVRAVDPASNTGAAVEVSWTVQAEDTDGDGLADPDEDTLGTDPDDADSDDDGLPDGAELSPALDTDGDGLINVLDPDSDDDGLFDGTELGRDCANEDTDLDAGMCRPDADPATTTSPVDSDTDDGGASDGSEDPNLDGAKDDGERDPTAGQGDDDDAVTDTDADGLGDDLEVFLRSDPNDADSDDDGVADGSEPNPSADGDRDGLIDVLDVDSDDDGVLDGTELGTDCTAAGTNAAANHCVADADSTTTTSAVNPDTDYGGVTDGNEDTNLDGAVDTGETNPVSGEDADDGDLTGRDGDGDGLSDETEATVGSDPNDADSDDDGLLDGAEPNFADDHDGDGTPNVLDSDSDDDALFDGTEAGNDCANPATDTTADQCVADADATTTTIVVNRDTDYGSVLDGDEDANHDGRFDTGERDPLNADDDDTGNGEGGAGGGGAGGAGTGATGPGGANNGGAAGAPVEGGAAGETGVGGSGGDGATGGTAGASPMGGAGVGGTLGGGGSGANAGSGASGGRYAHDPVVVLGGGICSFRPATATGPWAFLVAACLMASARVRRTRRRAREG